MENRIIKDPGMKIRIYNNALYFKDKFGKLASLCATYVSNSLRVGAEEYIHLWEEMESKLNCKRGELIKVPFAR